MALHVQHDTLEQRTGADVAVGNGAFLVGEVFVERTLKRFRPFRRDRRRHLGIAAEEQDTLDEGAGMAELLLQFLAHPAGHPIQPPIVKGMGMQKVLMDGAQLDGEGL